MIKFNKQPRKKLWIGSDFHFGHNKPFLFAKRGFDNIIDHDEALIADINDKVKKDDILIHLGDFSLKLDAINIKRIFDRIKCKNIVCLKGNHEHPLISYMKEYGYDDKKVRLMSRMEEFRYTVPSKEYGVKAIKHRFILSHFPIAVWAGVEKGYGNLCGHSHNTYPPAHHASTDEKMLDCGVESALDYNGGMIFNMDDIIEIMSKKQIAIKDRIHK